MTVTLVIAGCACSGPDAPIVRGSDGTLVCLECGADEAALVRYADALLILREMPLRDLAAEVDRRTAPDEGSSPQICPQCSTAEDEVIGEFSRNQGRFFCVHCSLILPASVYGQQLEAFQRNRWRARQSAFEMRELVRSAR